MTSIHLIGDNGDNKVTIWPPRELAGAYRPVIAKWGGAVVDTMCILTPNPMLIIRFFYGNKTSFLAKYYSLCATVVGGGEM